MAAPTSWLIRVWSSASSLTRSAEKPPGEHGAQRIRTVALLYLLHCFVPAAPLEAELTDALGSLLGCTGVLVHQPPKTLFADCGRPMQVFSSESGRMIN